MVDGEQTPGSSHSDLVGQRAVVTGSSRGIGRALALELAAAGADVLVHGRTRTQHLSAVVDCIRARGRAASALVGDLAQPADHDRLVEQAWAAFGGVEIWINNAGADVLTGEAADWPFERKLDQLWRVDVVATLRLSRLAGRRMQLQPGAPGSCCIVNIGWDQTAHGMAGDSGEMFAAVKGAIEAFSRSLARSLAPHVRVNCVAPGWIQTAWGNQAAEYWQQRARRESLLCRWGTPADVARAVRFLVSPAAGFINGQTLAVNGGWQPSERSSPANDDLTGAERCS